MQSFSRSTLNLVAFGLLCLPAKPDQTPGDPVATPPAPLNISTNSDSITIQLPSDGSAQFLQLSTDMAHGTWFNYPANAIPSGQTSFTFHLSELPEDSGFFRAICGSSLPSLQVGRERVFDHTPANVPWFNHTVQVDPKIMQKPDGTPDPAKFHRYLIEISFDGKNWSYFYDITPAQIQAAIQGPELFFFRIVDRQEALRGLIDQLVNAVDFLGK